MGEQDSFYNLQNETTALETGSSIQAIQLAPRAFDVQEREEVQNILKSFGISESLCALMDSWGINRIKNLECIELNEINILFEKIDSLGSKS